MYTVERPLDVEDVPLRAGIRRGWRGVGANVWFLGLTSLLTDVSSEMITSVLPLYLVLHLGMSPLGFGLVDGLQHGVSAILRLASGAISDRFRRYKEVAAAGYALSAACRMALIPAGSSLLALTSIMAVDRAGKGIRTSPRDALISLDARPEALGIAFGIHRSLDAGGAMLGPVVAFLMLAQRPDAFDQLFVVSFLIALAGLGALLLLVRNADGAHAGPASPTLAALASLARDARLRRLVFAAGALSLAVVSDGFLYLMLQRRSGLAASSFPLFFVGTSALYTGLAAPMGYLADRIGRRQTFLAGTALLLPAYATALFATPGWLAPVLCLVLLGAYYAATDGVVMALAAAILPAERRASGLALVTAVTGLARLAGSVVFGLVWTAWSLSAAVAVFAGLLVVALALATATFRGAEGNP